MVTFLNILILIGSAAVRLGVAAKLVGVSFTTISKNQFLLFATLLGGYFGFSRANMLFHMDIYLPTSVGLTFSVLLLLLFSALLFKRNPRTLLLATLLAVFLSLVTEIISGVVYIASTRALPSTPLEYFIITCLDTLITLCVVVFTKDKLTKIHSGLVKLLKLGRVDRYNIILGQIILVTVVVISLGIGLVNIMKADNSSYTVTGLGGLLILLLLGFNYVVLREVLGDKVKLAKLEQETLYTEAYSLVIQDVKTYWHNHSNILDSLKICLYSEDVTKDEMVQVIGEYLDWSTSRDIANKVKLTQLNHPLLAGLLKLKFDYALELGVTLSLNSAGSAPINMNMVEFIEVLGVLLDNAIEVACHAPNPVVDVDILCDDIVSIRILNFTKQENGITLKHGVSRGLGLKTVSATLRKYTNVQLEVSSEQGYYDVLFTVGG